MKNSFKCYIDSAAVQKKLFDESVDNVKESLNRVIEESSLTVQFNEMEDAKKVVFQKDEPAYSTGWLKGALSYPWAIVSIIIPSFLENIL